MDQIIIPSAFDISKIALGSIKTLDNGGKNVYISYADKPLYLQTPEMVAPFGLSKFENNDGVCKYSIDMSFKDQEKRKSVQKFFENMTQFNDLIINNAMENSMMWFKKKYTTTDVVSALFTPLIRFPKTETGEINTKFAPTFRVSVPTKENNFACDVYNNAGELINLKDIDVKGSHVTAIIKCMGVWLAGGKFGVTWKVFQLRIVQPNGIKGFAFQDIEDDKLVDDDEDNNTIDDPKDVIVFSDDEHEQEQHQDDEPNKTETETPVVKKVVRRKTAK